MWPHSQDPCREPAVAWIVTLLNLLSKFSHISRDSLWPAPHGAAACTAQANPWLLWSIPHSWPREICPDLRPIPPNTLSSPGHRENIAARTPNTALCTSFILGICRTQEPTRGAAGLEHLPTSAGGGSQRQALGSRAQGSVLVPVPAVRGCGRCAPGVGGGITLIFEGPGIRWPSGWGRVLDPLPWSLRLHCRGLGADLREVEEPEEANSQCLSHKTQWGTRGCPRAHSCNTWWRRGSRSSEGSIAPGSDNLYRC